MAPPESSEFEVIIIIIPKHPGALLHHTILYHTIPYTTCTHIITLPMENATAAAHKTPHEPANRHVMKHATSVARAHVCVCA